MKDSHNRVQITCSLQHIQIMESAQLPLDPVSMSEVVRHAVWHCKGLLDKRLLTVRELLELGKLETNQKRSTRAQIVFSDYTRNILNAISEYAPPEMMASALAHVVRACLVQYEKDTDNTLYALDPSKWISK